MTSNVKFPTMLTGVLDTHHDRCVQMVEDVCRQVLAYCLIREKVVTFRMVKLNLLLSIFLITK